MGRALADAPTAPPAALTLQGAGVQLRVYDYGNEGAPPMILIHGIQDFARSLEAVARGFREDYRVIAYDLRGHGDSDKPGLYSINHHLADLHSIVLQLGLERPVLVGHSLGGLIASHYAGLFTAGPSSLVSIEGLGPPFRDFEIPLERKQLRTRRGIESLLRPSSQGRPIKSRDHATRSLRRHHPRLDPEAARRLVELGTEPHPAGGLQWKWDTRVQTTWLSFLPALSEERWGWIECPVLQVSAGKSAEFWSRRRAVPLAQASTDPAELQRRLHLFRHCTHVEIAVAGHMIHYDTPDELAAVMRAFLGALDRMAD